MDIKITAENFKRITDVLVFKPNDTSVKAMRLQEELERQGELSSYYNDCYARLGKYKLRMERQVKQVRAQTELDFRTNRKKVEGIERMTDATVKACVETDPEVCAAEDLLVEITWWYNQASNYSLAMSQRLDIMRMLQREKDR